MTRNEQTLKMWVDYQANDNCEAKSTRDAISYYSKLVEEEKLVPVEIPAEVEFTAEENKSDEQRYDEQWVFQTGPQVGRNFVQIISSLEKYIESQKAHIVRFERSLKIKSTPYKENVKNQIKSCEYNILDTNKMIDYFKSHKKI